MAFGVSSALYGFGGAICGLAQAAQGVNTFTTTCGSTSNTIYWADQAGALRRAAAGSPAERVQASLPKTLRAELQEEVDAWLPSFETY